MMKRIFSAMLAVAIVTLGACSDDDETSIKNQFDFTGKAVSLKGANLYLTESGTFAVGHPYRHYFITDGTYVEGSGWSLSNYTDATYVLAVELAVPAEESFTKGNYPLYNSNSDLPETSRLAWVSFENEDDVYYETPEGVSNGKPVVISGAMNDDNTMTITFNGALAQDTDDGQVNVKGKFHFTGKVQDVRPALARAAASRGSSK